jgi:hypothetical protein
MKIEQKVNHSVITFFLIPHFSRALAPAAEIAVWLRLYMLVPRQVAKTR